MAHFSVVSLTQVVLLLVLIGWTPSSTGAGFSLEEEFLQLKENYIQMKQVVKILEAKVEQQDSLLTSLLREKNERSAAATDSVPISNNPSAVAINGLPSSCADLKIIGHIWSGFYSVMGSAKMESVYCDFTKPPGDAGFQKWIGYADVKSTPVHFYVQRNSTFSQQYTPLPFDLAVVNVGNAMNLTSGKFTAPAPGIYFFSFTGVAHLGPYFFSALVLNGSVIGTGFVQINGGPIDSPLTVQSTLNLKTGDQVWVSIYFEGGTSSYLNDLVLNYHLTHFTGFMLEEEIVASL
ncbi:C1q and tumor necrosis factor-related protein 5 [Daphnia pulex]|uniref:C1q and tumor necrosis factor-related protein 5 n=1 Tax=Daphnia pulex TaxID=6669 RepID=E9GCM5_DAPPU|nr:C1q and tumor necrosis factor-related protein 5 [Daphnia pulex]|eukprot:EFX82583.1 C1q and tumor necrosis factor-related protein 5 [Daphnia pulex]